MKKLTINLALNYFDKNSICRMTVDEIFQSIKYNKSRCGEENSKVENSIRPTYCPHDDYLTSMPVNSLLGMATKVVQIKNRRKY